MRRPKYKIIRDEMLREIEEKNYPPNTPFLTENEAIERYGASRITVRRSFELLEQDGLIYRVQGKGSFIAPHDAKPTKTVAFLATCIMSNGIESVLLRAIEDYIDNHDYNMIVANTNHEFSRTERYLKRFINAKIDAIIYICSTPNSNMSATRDLSNTYRTITSRVY